jgi:hypothetical protein
MPKINFNKAKTDSEKVKNFKLYYFSTVLIDKVRFIYYKIFVGENFSIVFRTFTVFQKDLMVGNFKIHGNFDSYSKLIQCKAFCI